MSPSIKGGADDDSGGSNKPRMDAASLLLPSNQSLLSRVAQFLPQLESANEILLRDVSTGSDPKNDLSQVDVDLHAADDDDDSDDDSSSSEDASCEDNDLLLREVTTKRKGSRVETVTADSKNSSGGLETPYTSLSTTKRRKRQPDNDDDNNEPPTIVMNLQMTGQVFDDNEETADDQQKAEDVQKKASNFQEVSIANKPSLTSQELTPSHNIDKPNVGNGRPLITEVDGP